MPLLARSASSWSESTAVTPCWSRSHAAFSGNGYSPTWTTGRVARGLVGEFAGRGLTGAEDLGAFARALVLEELAAVDAGAALALDADGLAQPLLDAAGLGAARGRGVVIEDVEGHFRARDGRLAGEHPWVPADEIAAAVVLHPERALIVREGWRLTPIAA